jgi:hypothetical protein
MAFLREHPLVKLGTSKNDTPCAMAFNGEAD